jgi:hypothetical protein
MTSGDLTIFLAQMCAYAQEHVDDADAWPIDPGSRATFFECTSYQVACFIAQNTLRGSDGVEAGIVLDQLIQRPAKTEAEWLLILDPLVVSYNDPTH